jgi:hypothetical protein
MVYAELQTVLNVVTIVAACTMRDEVGINGDGGLQLQKLH